MIDRARWVIRQLVRANGVAGGKRVRSSVCRLRVDSLESRNLPAGQLNLEAFVDANRNGVWDAGEQGLAGVVFTYAGQDTGNSDITGSLDSDNAGTSGTTLVIDGYSYTVNLPPGYQILVPVALSGSLTIGDG